MRLFNFTIEAHQLGGNSPGMLINTELKKGDTVEFSDTTRMFMRLHVVGWRKLRLELITNPPK